VYKAKDDIYYSPDLETHNIS